MPYYNLLSLLQAAADEQTAADEDPPEACPNDGEPLQEGSDGSLRCPFDGWVWSGTAVIY